MALCPPGSGRDGGVAWPVYGVDGERVFRTAIRIRLFLCSNQQPTSYLLRVLNPRSAILNRSHANVFAILWFAGCRVDYYFDPKSTRRAHAVCAHRVSATPPNEAKTKALEWAVSD